MENEKFEKKIYELIDNANCDIPAFKIKKRKHFYLKMLLPFFSTVCIIFIISITLTFNANESKNAANLLPNENEVNNVVPDATGNNASIADGAVENSSFLEQDLSGNTSSELSITLSSF